ncbi:ferredoxin-fold anticodon-binding domain-containing protein 1-like [Antedon mediterranea]|uniref:ferredoxin-fold anticodon-binding domain-containing protein 1-like n=1 Tax=Antedon mediterranea TaxID=105859 RepID=UPI003AF9C11E
MLEHLHKCHGWILLVGEGDFSFALSLNKHLQQVSLMIATCIEVDTPVKYMKAQENIDQLRESGGTVIFGVDATNLQSCKFLKGKTFDVVIFNFPHTGGKARIQDNRELLRKFFISASQCLTNEGKVLLTLCNGQGGTPADKPQREWGNSWQVVSMATYADLILTHTEEFVAETFPEYNCTGYRGQGKGFNVNGGVTHVFKKFPILQEPASSTILVHHKIGEHEYSFKCPGDLDGYITRNLLRDSNSPVHEVYHRILENCKHLFKDMLVTETKECNWIKCINTEVLKAFEYRLKEYKHVSEMSESVISDSQEDDTNESVKMGTKMIDNSQLCSIEAEDPGTSLIVNDHIVVDNKESDAPEAVIDGEISPYAGADCDSNSSQDNVFIFSPFIQKSQSKPEDKTELLVGPAFRRCAIQPTVFPITHEIHLFMANQSSMKDIVSLIVSSVCPDVKIKCEPLNLNISSQDSNQKSQQHLEESDNSDITQQALEKLSKLDLESQKDSPELGRSRSVSKYNMMQCQIWVDAARERWQKSESCETSREDFHQITLDNTCHVFGLIARQENANIEDKGLIILNLDLLAMLCFDIDDVRLLWLSHSLVKVPNSLDKSSYIPYSNHAPSYIRDLCFLVSTETSFSEMHFFSIVRASCGVYIKSVDLIDVYKEKNTTFYSLCYRFIYQSRTSALSRSKVNQVHQDLCCQLKSFHSIQLRY